MLSGKEGEGKLVEGKKEESFSSRKVALVADSWIFTLCFS